MKTKTIILLIISNFIVSCQRSSIDDEIKQKNQINKDTITSTVDKVNLKTSKINDATSKTNSISKKEAIKEARSILQEIKLMEAEGRKMSRFTQNDINKCKDKYKYRLQRIEELRGRVNKLPKMLQIYLGSGLAGLISCLYCDSEAISFCDDVKYSIKEADKTISDYENDGIN